VLVGAASVCASSYIGGRADAVLRPAAGADAQAMGNANTAAPTYLMSLWNPSAVGMLEVKERHVALGGGLRALGRTEGVGSLEFRIPPRVGLGLSMLYRGDPKIEIYDDMENPAGSASYTTLHAKLALAYRFTRQLSIGAALGMLYQTMPAAYIYSVNSDGQYKTRTEPSWAFSIGGIDLGATLQLRDNLKLALVFQNFNVTADWQFSTGSGGGLDRAGSWALNPVTVLASSYEGRLAGKPLIWNCDLKSYLLTGSFKPIDHVSATLNNGVEWRRWDTFFVRAGLSDLTFEGTMLRDRPRYLDDFTLGLSAGFSADLSRVARGLRFNYGIALSKALAGVDQQMSLVYGLK